MIDIVDRLRFDSVRCETQFSRGIAGNINEAADKIEQMLAALKRIDAINDNPSCFSKEINDLCDPILRPHLNR